MGKTVLEVLRIWRGGNGAWDNIPDGFSETDVVDSAFIADKDRMARFFYGKSAHEGAGNEVLSLAQWGEAFQVFQTGSYQRTLEETREVEYYLWDFENRISKLSDPAEYSNGSKPFRLMSESELSDPYQNVSYERGIA